MIREENKKLNRNDSLNERSASLGKNLGRWNNESH